MAAYARYQQANCPPRKHMHNNRPGHYTSCWRKQPGEVAADRALKQRALDACMNGGVIP